MAGRGAVRAWKGLAFGVQSGLIRCIGANGGISMRLAFSMRQAGLALLLSTMLMPMPAQAEPQTQAQSKPRAESFSLAAAMDFPFVAELASNATGTRVAWMRNVGGVRNIWVADAVGMKPRMVTQFSADDGQELTQITLSPDGKTLVFVRGGDHDANWPAEGNLAPDPTSDIAAPSVMLWRADVGGTAAAAPITEGDAPAISATGMLAYVKDGAVWTVGLDGKVPRRLFFDRGRDGSLAWSPDGKKLAFVSDRGDHGFIGIWRAGAASISWLAPSTGRDASPVWSPDGTRVAFTRQPGKGGPPPQTLVEVPDPWSIWTADAATGAGRLAWASGKAKRDSLPDVAGGANLHWAAGDRLVFLSEQTNWQQLYTVPATGGAATRLTPDGFMIEHIAMTPDGTAMVYSANTGAAADDDTRRHIFRVSVAGGPVTALTSGDGLEWTPVGLAGGGTAFVAAGAREAPALAVVDAAGRRTLAGQAAPANFAGAKFVVPKKVQFTAPDGQVVFGQLFETPGGAVKKPGLIFVHGGPPRQMLLGFSYMDYYSNAYAMNQYLAAHGFTVLSVNYRLGIGYGRDFQHAAKGGAAGSSEYQDVVAGARFLAGVPGVDAARLGIWGGSYGGLLTALGLARNSDVFKAGVDFHGVHDWSRFYNEIVGKPALRYEQGDREAFLATAFHASPVADVATWRSPVLLIHGDDDRNVRFSETIDLARRLDAQGVDYEELVIPDEIHGFLRHANWLRAYGASAEFLTRKLGAK
jgi:dipeptidyl aminopeptidase/acylaminoacyl peptidase